MAQLSGYNVKIPVYCTDEAQAKTIQAAVTDIVSGKKLIGSEILGFYSKFKKNETVIRPILRDVFVNGPGAIGRHILTLRKIKL